MQKNNYILGFILGVILTLGTGFVIIKPSLDRSFNYPAKYQELRKINKSLAESVRDRERNIQGLQFIGNRIADANRRFEISIRERENIIKKARGYIQSTNDSLSRLEYIIQAFQKIEQSYYTNPNYWNDYSIIEKLPLVIIYLIFEPDL